MQTGCRDLTHFFPLPQPCTLRRVTTTSAGSCANRPSRWAGRTGKTIARSPSECCGVCPRQGWALASPWCPWSWAAPLSLGEGTVSEYQHSPSLQPGGAPAPCAPSQGWSRALDTLSCASWVTSMGRYWYSTSVLAGSPDACVLYPLNGATYLLAVHGFQTGI